MKKRLLKLLLLVVLFGVPHISGSDSYFSSQQVISGNSFSTTCWSAPNVPNLIYPADGVVVDSVWLQNPVMDWSDSTSSCPNAGQIVYQYESFYDLGLTQLAYSSDWLTNSFIPAPGTPDATYYWHVRAKDSFGNTSAFSAPFKFTVDRSAFLAPQNLHWKNPDVSCGGYTNSYTIIADWDNAVSPYGITSYVYEITYPKLGGGIGVWQTSVSPSEYSGTFNQAEGLHTYHVYATDGAGRNSPWSADCSITYDKTAPESVITSPVSSNNNHADISISSWDGKIEGTATDSLSGVNRVEISVQKDSDKFWNGTNWVSGSEDSVRVGTTGTTNWSYQISGTILSGSYRIISHAIDNAGNVENSATIEFDNEEIVASPALIDISTSTTPTSSPTPEISPTAALTDELLPTMAPSSSPELSPTTSAESSPSPSPELTPPTIESTETPEPLSCPESEL